MAVFGGIMVPHVVMPLVMKKLAMISPMYWAHQAYLDVFLRDADFSFYFAETGCLDAFCVGLFLYSGEES